MSPGVADITLLLEPLPGASPAGDDLRYAGLYDQVREARRADDGLDPGEWKRGAPKTADWERVERLCREALRTRTKDLQVAGWLAEALVRRHGLAGLRDGLALVDGLLRRYPDSLHPLPEGDDFEARANSLEWVADKLALALRDVPLTASAAGALTFNHWEESRPFDVPDPLDGPAHERLAALADEAEAAGTVSGRAFRRARAATPAAFYDECAARLREVRESLGRLHASVDDCFGRDTPGFGRLAALIDHMEGLVARVRREREPRAGDVSDVDLADMTDTSDDAGGGGAAPDGGDLVPAVAIRSRQEAVRRLAEVAAYFRRAEPHSPVACLVEKSVAWARLSLEEWLAQVIKDESVLSGVRELLGVVAPAP